MLCLLERKRPGRVDSLDSGVPVRIPEGVTVLVDMSYPIQVQHLARPSGKSTLWHGASTPAVSIESSTALVRARETEHSDRDTR